LLNKRTNSNTPKKRIICHLYWSENFNGCFVALFCSVALAKRMCRRFWLVCGFIYSTISSYAAISIIFDYSYDTGNYFGDEQRYIMEQVAYAFESRMGGTSFTSSNPADYGGTSASNPQFTFTNPTTGGGASVVPGSTTSEGNVIGNADELVIFLGARSRGVNPLADAGPAGYGTGPYFPPDSWVSAMQAKIHPLIGNLRWELHLLIPMRTFISIQT
jgi:hypothetical protein